VLKVGTFTLNADKTKVPIAAYDVNSHKGHTLQGMGSKSIEVVWATPRASCGGASRLLLFSLQVGE